MAAVIGLGFVGSAIVESLQVNDIEVYGYDKYKNGGIGCFEKCMKYPMMFLCLPTPFDEQSKAYDKSSIDETMQKLHDHRYAGTIVIKSTVEPGTTEELSEKFPTLAVIHNPEFLSAATAFQDFHNQTHIVLGRGSNCEDSHIESLYNFYHEYYPKADISVCTAKESESMKAFVNTFYAVKIQYFNELFLVCQNNQINYQTVKDLMLKNGWINPMHTSVPGRDGKLSYGGGCFPKDTNALLQHMKKIGTPHAVLEACVNERNVMREENAVNSSKINSSLKKAELLQLEKPVLNGHMTNGSLTNGFHH